MKPILSILVPTFNRAYFLERLLSGIEMQLRECCQERDVEVAISDNASEDLTLQVLDRFSRRNKSWMVIKNSANLGADANMLKLLSKSSGSFKWVIGDDDLPAPGLLPYILNLILGQSPSLIYLPSVWSPDISTLKIDSVPSYSYRCISGLGVACELNIWVTFVSSWVFNADQLFAGLSSMEQISSGQGTSFIQLGWILPLLTYPQSTIFIAQNPAILATSGNTGGYSILRAFLVNYPGLVCKYTPGFTRIRLALIGKALRSYMPRLILSVRLGKAYRNSGDNAGIFSDSFKLLWYYPSFWLLCLPALLAPVGLIQFILSLVSAVKRIFQKCTKLS